jgi:hypothetical protein
LDVASSEKVQIESPVAIARLKSNEMMTTHFERCGINPDYFTSACM